jgi:hypothetical protein
LRQGFCMLSNPCHLSEVNLIMTFVWGQEPPSPCTASKWQLSQGQSREMESKLTSLIMVQCCHGWLISVAVRSFLRTGVSVDWLHMIEWLLMTQKKGLYVSLLLTESRYMFCAEKWRSLAFIKVLVPDMDYVIIYFICNFTCQCPTTVASGFAYWKARTHD